MEHVSPIRCDCPVMSLPDLRAFAILVAMKTISLAVSESDYEAFRLASQSGGRSVAQLIREAMAVYRTEHLQERTLLNDFPVLVGHRLIGELPSRETIHDEMLDRESE